MEVVETK